MKKTRFNALKSLLIAAAICAGFAAGIAGNMGADTNAVIVAGGTQPEGVLGNY